MARIDILVEAAEQFAREDYPAKLHTLRTNNDIVMEVMSRVSLAIDVDEADLIVEAYDEELARLQGEEVLGGQADGIEA